MKSKLFALALLACVSTAALAQEKNKDIPFFQFGPKVGVNITKIDGKSFKDEFNFGFHAGAFATIKIGQEWQIQPEVLFNQLATKTDTSFGNIFNTKNLKNVKLNYLSIPILLNFSPSKVFTIQAGPQFGLLLDKHKDLVQNGKDAFKGGDLSLLGGVQLSIMNFKISGRYFIGLSDINDATSSDKWTNQGFQLSVGLRII
jgi:hypothetical protein